MRHRHLSSLHRFILIPAILLAPACAPAGQVAAAGSEEPAGATQVAAAGAAANPRGREVYNEVCVACHGGRGVGGAPPLGDAEAWAPRLAQGADTLNDHAVHGFSSSAGLMPAKGGRLDLPDEDIIAAVDYMIGQLQ